MVKVIGVIVGLIIAALVIPVPYFVGEDIVCAPGVECPKNVWSYKPPLLKQLLTRSPQDTATALVSPSPVSSPRANIDPMVTPVIKGLEQGDVITSPLQVSGTVPPGWMFEGSAPVKLVTEDKKVIVQTFAQESIGGSWQSGNPIEFATTITFPATTGSGYLVIEKDNPSGLPENAASYEIPIKFSE